ncbi:hypothetical protein [Hahella ganghwensis]|uniref:hypothetical protein n=1 Tax=Hahella ganghwensis TaxID=286420 RepID=UPI00035C1DE6|nr:hypothetical protein [Hahella ganghwensis]
MSSNYLLLCIDCNEGLDLGKTFKIRLSTDDRESYGFDAIGGLGINRELGDKAVYVEETIEFLQFFLMKHRLHEIRVLPDTVKKYETQNSSGIPDPYPDYEKYGEYMKAPIVKPDPDKEADILDKALIEKLKNL